MFGFGSSADIGNTRATMDFVVALVSVLADPKATKSAITSMRDRLDEIEADTKIRDEEATRRTEAFAAEQQRLNDREAGLVEREKIAQDIMAMKTAAEDAQAKATIDAAKIAELNERFDVTTAELAGREDTVRQREIEADHRQASLNERDEVLKVAEADYQRRRAELKAIVGDK